MSASTLKTAKRLAEIALRMGEAWASGALGLLRRGGLRSFLRFFFGRRSKQ